MRRDVRQITQPGTYGNLLGVTYVTRYVQQVNILDVRPITRYLQQTNVLDVRPITQEAQQAGNRTRCSAYHAVSTRNQERLLEKMQRNP